MKPLLCGLLALGLLARGAGQAEADYIFTNLESNDPNSEPINPTAINNLGQIVGYDQTGARSFLLSGGSYTIIPVPASQAYGINDAGEIVGHYISGRQNRGFIYQNGGFSDFFYPLNGVNNSGQIVGFTRTTGFLLSPQGGTTTIAVPGSTSTLPYKINDSGQIVGLYTNSAGVLQSFLFTAGSYTTLRVPGVLAYGINNDGQIVGENIVNGVHAFLLSDSSYTTVEPPGSLASVAFGNNDAGQIVGFYLDAAGVAHGYLATPTPEPATLLLLALAAPLLVGFRLLRNWPPRRKACDVDAESALRAHNKSPK